jgi:hypothetical protein
MLHGLLLDLLLCGLLGLHRVRLVAIRRPLGTTRTHRGAAGLLWLLLLLGMLLLTRKLGRLLVGHHLLGLLVGHRNRIRVGGVARS